MSDELPTTPWEAGGVTRDRFVTGGTEREGIFELGDVNIFPTSGPGPVAIAAGADIAAQIVKAVNSHDALVKALRDADKHLDDMGYGELMKARAIIRKALRGVFGTLAAVGEGPKA